jgi:hypothetical protein
MDAIIDRVSEWADSREAASIWYSLQPLAAFGGLTAESLVNGLHARALRDYLDGISDGVFA